MSDLVALLDQFRQVNHNLESIREEGAERGRRLWERLGEQGEAIAVLSHRVATLEETQAKNASQLSTYGRIHAQAQGAGLLGKFLIWFGGWLIAAAYWLYTSWSEIGAVLARVFGR